MKHFKSSNQIGLFFVYLNSFQIGVKIKNCPLHRDWNSNGRSKRQVRWPLPRPTISSKAVKKPRSASSKMGLIKFANSDNWMIKEPHHRSSFLCGNFLLRQKKFCKIGPRLQFIFRWQLRRSGSHHELDAQREAGVEDRWRWVKIRQWGWAGWSSATTNRVHINYSFPPKF